MNSLLVVEDDPRLRATLELQLSDAGFDVTTAQSAEQALDFFDQSPRPDLLLVDVRLGGKSGVELVEILKRQGRLPPTIVASGEATMSETVKALRLGVVDFLEKPFTRERLLRSIELALELTGLRRQVEQLESSPEQALIGESEGMLQLKEQVRKAAVAPSRVLITGESGTGKELAAEALHRLSPRSDRPFVRINCGAISAQLIEDELFGHVKGAFTDARATRPGLFEVANGGTLFLDEIGDMDPGLQTRLLRVIEDGRVRRLGDSHEREVDVRVVAATHRTLSNSETFREDLFYRLAELRLTIPPLRERGRDLELLFDRLLRDACRKQHTRPRTVSTELRACLYRHRWPGNVRELKNVCSHLAVFGGETLTPEDLPSSVSSEAGETEGTEGLLRVEELPRNLTLKDFKRGAEREFLEAALRRADWNFTRAARELGTQRTHLHDRARVLGINRPGREELDTLDVADE